MKRILMLAVLSVSLGVSMSAQVITNGSFEDWAYSYCTGTESIYPGNQFLIGWSVGQGIIERWCGDRQASHGDASVHLIGVNGLSSIYQDVPTVPGVVYQVTFDMSGLGYFPPATKTMTVTADGSPTADYAYTDQGNTLSDMNWEPRTYVFTAANTSTRLTFTSTTPAPWGPYIDNVFAYERAGLVCHTNNGSGQPRTLNLTEGWAFWAHTQHGDQIGACP